MSTLPKQATAASEPTWQRWWHQLTSPPSGLDDPFEEERLRLFLNVVALSIPVYLLLAELRNVVLGGPAISYGIPVVLVLALLLFFVLAHTRRFYQVSLYGLPVFVAAVALGTVIVQPEFSPAAGTVLYAIAASIVFLPVPVAVVYTGLMLLGLLALPLLNQEVVYTHIIDSFILTAGMTLLIFMVSIRRRQRESTVHRQQAELAASERRYRAVVEGQTDLIAHYTPDGHLTFVNRAYARYVSRPPEELIGEKFLLLVPSKAAKGGEPHARTLTTGTLEHMLVRQNGEVRWTEWRNRPLRDARGKIVEYQAVGRDITHRKRIEDHYRRLVELLPEAVFVLNSLGEIRFCNTAATRLPLVTPDENMIGMNMMALTHPESRESLQDMIVQALHADRQVIDQQETLLKTDGQPLHVELSAIPFSFQGHPAVQMVVQDITRRVQTEKERETLITELDAFAHTVAHNLKNPLNLLMGYTSLLVDPATTIAEEERHFAQRVMSNARRIDRIITELLRLAELRSDEDLPLETLHTEHIVAEAFDRLSYMFEESNAIVEQPESWPPAVGYAPWIEEVWANYLSNAVKYGGTPPHLRLGADEMPDGRVRFWVQDNGDGLSAAEQARLFNPFTRIDRTRATGHGLGLSIVRRIVERLGGEVGVESEPGKGSRFYFVLPGVEQSILGVSRAAPQDG